MEDLYKYQQINSLVFIVISLLLAVIIVLFAYQGIIIILLGMFAYISLKQNSNYILFFIIMGYIAFSSEFYEEYRTYFLVLSSFSLIIFFMKVYGLDYTTYPNFPSVIKIFVLLLLITLILSTIFSTNFYTSSIALIRTSIFLIIVYLFYAMIRSKQIMYLYIFSILLVVLLVGYRMILDLMILGPQLYFMRVLVSDAFQLQGNLGYTGFTIFFISISMIVSFFFLDKFSKTLKVFLFTPLLLFNILIIILANSRGGIIASISSIAFLLFFMNRRIFLKSVVAVILTIILSFLISSPIQEAVEGYLRLDTVSHREAYWNLGLEIIQEYPIFGVGADMFDKHFNNYASSSHLLLFKTGANIFGKPHPHNFFLFFTSENGILGFVTAVSLFIIFFRIGYLSIKMSKGVNKDYYVLSIAITGVGVGLLIRTFIEISGLLTYGYITRDLPFWLLFVILIKIYMELSTEKFPIKE